MRDPKFARISDRRWRKEKRRRFSRRLKARRSEAHPSVIGGYRSPILELFVEDGVKAGQKLPPKTFKAPSKFSISKNPAGCLNFLRNIVNYARSARRPRIILDQRGITFLGLGADSILGVVLSEIRLELQYAYGAYIRGFKPKAKPIQTLMDEVGSVRALFMEAEEDIRLSFRSQAKVFRHRHKSSDEGRATPLFDPTAQVISHFSDHLNKALRFTGRVLSVEGRDLFCQYAAEILDNVKEHGGLREWAVVGYIDPSDVVPTYRCVIFSFGTTIADSFLQLPKDSFPMRVIEPYLETHRGGSLFNDEWHEHDLITLIALQGDVSSKNTSPSSDRGQGTVELIRFFQGISMECGIRQHPAEMNLISGGTRIRFDGRYSMDYRSDLQRHVIAFNDTNDLNRRPDKTAVMPLRNCRFPGTLITIEIPLTVSFLDAKDSSYENRA